MEEKQVRHFIRKGIYGKGDVPIRILDIMIGVIFALIVIMVVVFASNGGYNVYFDTQGGNTIETQKLKHGSLVTEPENPVRAGYEFDGWSAEKEGEQDVLWNFEEDIVENEMTLYAVWSPAEITVRFDLDGGYVDEGTGKTENAENKTVIFGETYGALPTPEKDGYVFDGWVYSGDIIDEDTVVMTSGEHVLTATYKALR